MFISRIKSVKFIQSILSAQLITTDYIRARTNFNPITKYHLEQLPRQHTNAGPRLAQCWQPAWAQIASQAWAKAEVLTGPSLVQAWQTRLGQLWANTVPMQTIFHPFAGKTGPNLGQYCTNHAPVAGKPRPIFGLYTAPTLYFPSLDPISGLPWLNLAELFVCFQWTKIPTTKKHTHALTHRIIHNKQRFKYAVCLFLKSNQLNSYSRYFQPS